jgi:quinol monooxygenase YgiN
MQTVIVRYTVTPEFVGENVENIQAVMKEHRALGDASYQYQAFQEKDDPCTFTHIGFYADDAAKERATNLESFAAFQKALKASGPVSPPQATWFDLIGSSRPLFEG